MKYQIRNFVINHLIINVFFSVIIFLAYTYFLHYLLSKYMILQAGIHEAIEGDRYDHDRDP